MSFFAEFPLDHPEHIRAALPFFLEHNICPELDFNAPHSLVMSREAHRDLAAVWQKRNLACAAHLPFEIVDMGAAGFAYSPALQQRLFQAVEAAGPYAPLHYIGHPNLPLSMSGKALKPYIDLWQRVALACAPGMLYLENIIEPDPDMLTSFLPMLEVENVGICFDIGHWHALSQGMRKKDLARWITVLTPHLRHMHLHDNRGQDDDHLPLGKGCIPLDELPPLLHDLPVRPGVTFEAHGHLPTLQGSLDYLQAHPLFCAALGLSQQ